MGKPMKYTGKATQFQLFNLETEERHSNKNSNESHITIINIKEKVSLNKILKNDASIIAINIENS